MPLFVRRSVVSPPRVWLVTIALSGAASWACDAEPDEGLFGASAAGPMATVGPGGTAGEAADPDTDGASDGSRADSGDAAEGTGADEPPDSGPADSNGEPVPPPPGGDSGGGTFDPLDDGGADAGGSTSFGDDGGAATSGGGGLPSDCCSAGVGAGCSDPAVEACVCAGDSFCCDTQWDDLCAESASLCGANCGGGGGGGGCCMVQAGPGCPDPAIQGCVCLIDPFCCDTQWDAACVQEAQVDCGAVC